MLQNKVRIFYSRTCTDLEHYINDFIEGKTVYDIKFTHTVDRNLDQYYRALIWYCDDAKEETTDE